MMKWENENRNLIELILKYKIKKTALRVHSWFPRPTTGGMVPDMFPFDQLLIGPGMLWFSTSKWVQKSAHIIHIKFDYFWSWMYQVPKQIECVILP